MECDENPDANFNVSATDNCDDNVDIEFTEIRNDLGCAGSFTLTRTWIAIDDCGNSSADVQVVTVGDNTAPVIGGVPTDITVECGNVPNPVNATATDNCDGNVVVTVDEFIEDGGCENRFVITRQFTATDNCGNETVLTQRISVEDNTSPVLVGIPSDVNAECDAAVVNDLPQVTATDNCDADVSVEFFEEILNSTCANSQSIVRTWIATDNCGNTAIGTQTITVGDNTAPTLVGVPTDVSIECGNVPNAPAVTATDNCDANVIVELTENQINGSCVGNFTLVRTWTATDACGNSSTASQNISCLLYTSPSPRDGLLSRMPSSA